MSVLARFQFAGLLTIAMLFTQSHSAYAATPESVTTEPSDPGAAIASDEPTADPPDAVQVALELLRLQEELGGSIVTDFAAQSPDQAPPWIAPQTDHTPSAQRQHKWAHRRPSPVEALRQTSWQLEQSAHLLESLDLYEQADAVRATASVLRRDARFMKTRHKKAGSAAE